MKMTQINQQVELIDCGQLVRKRQESPNWKKSTAIVEQVRVVLHETGGGIKTRWMRSFSRKRALKILRERGFADPASQTVSAVMAAVCSGLLIKNAAEWFKLPHDWQKLDAVYAADDKYCHFDEYKQADTFNNSSNYISASACFQTRRDVFISLLKEHIANGGRKILSIGSGSTTMELIAIAESGRNDVHLLAIDKNEDSIKTAIARAQTLGLGDILVLHNSDILDIDWRMTEKYDIVASVGFVTNYLAGETLISTLQKMRNQLCDNGGIILVDICFPDTDLIDYLGRILHWPVASISGSGLQTLTIDELTNIIYQAFGDDIAKIRVHHYIYGALAEIRIKGTAKLL